MRLFVALPLPQEITGRIAVIGKEIAAEGVSTIEGNKMHITVRFIGETDKEKEIVEKLKKIRFGKFRCKVLGVGVFPSEHYVRVVWAAVESNGALEGLAKAVNDELKGFGISDKRFSTHITIARVKGKVDFTEFIKKYSKNKKGSPSIFVNL